MDKLIACGTVVDFIVCDLPYGKTRCKWDIIIPFEELWPRFNALIKPNGAIALFGTEPFSSHMRLSNEKYYKYDWKWEKTQAVGHFNAKRQPLSCYEDIAIFYRSPPTYNPQKTTGHKPINSYTKYLSTVNKSEVYGKSRQEVSGGGETDRYPRNIIKFKSDKQTEYLHPSQKPLALLEYLIKTYTNKGETVFDCCMGSGTAGVAALKNDRDFIGIELIDKYFDIASSRIHKVRK